MNNFLSTVESPSRCTVRPDERSTAVILALCLLLFVDVELPFVGSSNRLIALAIIAFVILGRRDLPISTPFTGAVAVLIPLYYLLPPLVHPEDDAHNFAAVFVFQMACVGAMLLLANVMAEANTRERLVDLLILFAAVSAVVAIMQWYGVAGALGRERWIHATVSSSTLRLRGAGFLADPNFMAILLASTLPLIINWRFTRLRWPVLAVIILGINTTNSRSGIILAMLAVLLSVAARSSFRTAIASVKGRRAVFGLVACLIALFAFNVGGQRDRVIEGVFIGLGIKTAPGGVVDREAANSALYRREIVQPWFEVGVENFPFGSGLAAQDKVVQKVQIPLGAHNTFVQSFAQGGMAGLLISFTSIWCLLFFIRRRTEPFAIMGIVFVISGMVLSWPGLVFIVLPMGLADGIRAGQLGVPAPRSHRTPAGATFKGVQSERESVAARFPQ